MQLALLVPASGVADAQTPLDPPSLDNFFFPLLAAGANGKRRALPNARIMIHQPLAGMEGTAEEIMIHAKEFKNIKHKLNGILLKHTGHPLEKIEQDTDRDRFMSAQEARDYRLIDEVIERMPANKTA